MKRKRVLNPDSDPQGRIVVISRQTWHTCGRVHLHHHQLRYKIFVLQRYWSGVHSIDGLEYDEYDGPAAHYLVWATRWGEVLGCLRLSPTDRPYMLKDKFPQLCDAPPPSSLSIWEVTRLCVDQSLAPVARRRIKQDLLTALVEFSLRHDIRQLVAVTHPKLWQSVFISAGWNVEFLGEEKMLGDGIARAGLISISLDLLKIVRGVSTGRDES